MDGQAPEPEKHSADYRGVYGKKIMREESKSPELETLRQTGLVHISSFPSGRDKSVGVSSRKLGWQIAKRIVRPVGDAEMRELAQVALRGVQSPLEQE